MESTSVLAGVCWMSDWNVLVTCYRNRGGDALRQLRGLGRFDSPRFRDVVLGRVDSLETLLSGLDDVRFSAVSRVVPIDHSFYFSMGGLWEKLEQGVRGLVPRISPDETFGVRCNRRGFEEDLNSQEVEERVGSWIQEWVGEEAGEPAVDLEDPGVLVSVEIVGNWCGVSTVSRDVREKHYELRL